MSLFAYHYRQITKYTSWFVCLYWDRRSQYVLFYPISTQQPDCPPRLQRNVQYLKIVRAVLYFKDLITD